MHRFSYFSHNWRVLKDNNRCVGKLIESLRGTVYDLGCGTQPYKIDILVHADEYVGVDWSQTPHTLVADVVADLNEPLPVESGAADAVVSFQVMEHVRKPDFMLKEAHRILKDGGSIIMMVPFQWWVHEAPYDYFRYTPYGLHYLFEEAGFEHIEITPTSGVMVVLIMKVNYFSVRFIRGPAWLRWLIRFALTPFWFVLQALAPWLDRLDRDKELEASGFSITARKPRLQPNT